MDSLIIRIEDFKLPRADYPYHSHDSYDTQLMVVKEGSAIQIVNGKESFTKRGDVYVIGEGCGHGFRDADGLRILNVVFNANVLNRIARDLRELMGYQALFVIEPKIGSQQYYEQFMHLNSNELAYCCNQIAQMLLELDNHRPGYATSMNALFLLLIVYLSRQYEKKPEDNSCRAPRLAQAVAYMESNYMYPITKKELADQASLSERQLSRIFQEVYHIPPMEYLNHLRITTSRQLLRSTDRSITQIALDCGFSDGAYFSKVFKKDVGCSPIQFRKRQMEE